MITSRCKKIYRINTLLGLILVGTFAALIYGCASMAHVSKSYGSYEIGKQATARVGTPMLIRGVGTIEKKGDGLDF